MGNREKVLKRLEKCKRYECADCTEIGASHTPWACSAYDYFVEDAITLLKEQPEIVRCKYCKWFSEKGFCKHPDGGAGNIRPTDWFCADGALKDNE